MKRIHTKRKAFDQIDNQIINLLMQRLDLSKEIGMIKQNLGLPVQDKDRENSIFQKIKERTSPEYSDSVMRIYKVILNESKHTQQTND